MLLSIIGGFILFCLIGTMVWLFLKAGGILAIVGIVIIISAIAGVVYAIKDRI